MNRRIIKVLAIISLLLFFLPFFQMCSDDNLMIGPIKTDSSETEELRKVNEGKLRPALLKAAKEQNTFTGYDFALDSNLSVASVFTLMMISNFIIVVNSFRNQFKSILILLYFHIILLLFAFGIFAYWAEEINQIKYGFLLYVLNIFLITVFVYKENVEINVT